MKNPNVTLLLNMMSEPQRLESTDNFRYNREKILQFLNV